MQPVLYQARHVRPNDTNIRERPVVVQDSPAVGADQEFRGADAMEEYLSIIRDYVDSCPYRLELPFEAVRKTYIHTLYCLDPSKTAFDQYMGCAQRLKLFTDLAGSDLPKLEKMRSLITIRGTEDECDYFCKYVLYLRTELLLSPHGLVSLMIYESIASKCTALGELILSKYKIS